MAARAFRTYLDPDLARHVEAAAESEKRSASEVIAEAVRLRAAARTEAVLKAEEENIKRQLSRIEKRLDKIVWEGAQLKEMVLLFVRVWLEYNPQLDPEHEESAAASAEVRFERFLDIISHGLSAGRSLADIDVRMGLHDDLREHVGAEAPA